MMEETKWVNGKPYQILKLLGSSIMWTMSATTICRNGTLKTGASNTGPKHPRFCSMPQNIREVVCYGDP